MDEGSDFLSTTLSNNIMKDVFDYTKFDSTNERAKIILTRIVENLTICISHMDD